MLRAASILPRPGRQCQRNRLFEWVERSCRFASRATGSGNSSPRPAMSRCSSSILRPIRARQKNLAEAHPEIVADLAGELSEWDATLAKPNWPLFLERTVEICKRPAHAVY